MHWIYSASVLLVLSACMTNQDAASRPLPKDCDVFDLEQIFQNPAKFHRKKFCGTGVPYLSSRMDMFHPKPAADLNEALETALLLIEVSANVRRKIDQLKPGDVVTIVGEIEADHCLKLEPNPLESCVPVRHPIFIADPTLHVEHGSH